jgi:NADPH-dependent curcumin reductase CurA
MLHVPTTSREIHLARRPVGEPTPDDFELVTVELPDPGEGEILVRNRYMSVDPYMRGRMDDRPSYVPPFELGKPLMGGTVGEVAGTGELVLHDKGWRESAVVRRDHVVPLPALEGVRESAFLGTLGMPGLTAWVGLTEIAPVASGETVFISAAAGGVGNVAGQLAAARGCRVIGSAGGPEKVELVRSLGFHEAFDYRAGPARSALRELAPDGIDVYFDNVGGEQLEAAIGALRRGGRIALCGAVAGYNAVEPPPGPRNLALLIGKRATVRGFIVADHGAQREAFLDEVGGLVGSGKMQILETVVEGGVGAAPEAFLDMLRGRYRGKVSVAL